VREVTLLPRHRAVRIVAAVWLLAAVAMLVVTLLRPELQTDERRALSSLVPLYFMSFPLGHAGLAAVIKLKIELYVANEFVPGIFPEGVWLWTLLTVLGYVQWFLLPPLISSAIRWLGCSYTAWRTATR
jgi:hypothetical protein